MSEKKSLLDSLYDGEIFPAEDIVPQSDEYQEAVDKQSRIQNRLESKLPEKHHALLERFVAAIECTHTIELRQTYAEGVRFGFRLMLESLWEGGELPSHRKRN
ncbi:DUF6809 family protein [Acutalibacter intestini]|mgnify:CR=1 FL=1|jgi:hypothetical protein|uniref:DUF6809 family protein n=1 Tax=Acutalibacter intestini TaxID=3093659 RepID=UPI002AC9401D|nr:DUF6809 family protein [Acutalibacter sp. M00204]